MSKNAKMAAKTAALQYVARNVQTFFVLQNIDGAMIYFKTLVTSGHSARQ